MTITSRGVGELHYECVLLRAEPQRRLKLLESNRGEFAGDS